MKKTAALASASLLGFGCAAVVATPAHAAEITTPCATMVDHLSGIDGTVHDNWFSDCIPQYGLGKVEFEITSDEPFPAEFLPLSDPGVTSTYSGDHDAATLYWTGSLPAPLPEGFNLFDGSAHPTYMGSLMLPIAGVSRIDPATLPAACAPDVNTYEAAFRVDYEPVTITFVQTIDAEEWEYRLTIAPEPVLSGFNFGTDELDGDAPQCLILNDANLFALNDDVDEEVLFGILMSGAVILTPWEVDITEPEPFDLGEIPRYFAPVAPGPGLADTGAEISPIVLGAGAVALLGGIGLLTVSRIRKSRRDNA